MEDFILPSDDDRIHGLNRNNGHFLVIKYIDSHTLSMILSQDNSDLFVSGRYYH